MHWTTPSMYVSPCNASPYPTSRLPFLDKEVICNDLEFPSDFGSDRISQALASASISTSGERFKTAIPLNLPTPYGVQRDVFTKRILRPVYFVHTP